MRSITPALLMILIPAFLAQPTYANDPYERIEHPVSRNIFTRMRHVTEFMASVVWERATRAEKNRLRAIVVAVTRDPNPSDRSVREFLDQFFSLRLISLTNQFRISYHNAMIRRYGRGGVIRARDLTPAQLREFNIGVGLRRILQTMRRELNDSERLRVPQVANTVFSLTRTQQQNLMSLSTNAFHRLYNNAYIRSALLRDLGPYFRGANTNLHYGVGQLNGLLVEHLAFSLLFRAPGALPGDNGRVRMLVTETTQVGASAVNQR